MVNFMLDNDSLVALEFDPMLLTIFIEVIYSDTRMSNYIARDVAVEWATIFGLYITSFRA